MKKMKTYKKNVFKSIIALVLSIVLLVSYLPMMPFHKVEGQITEQQRINGAKVFFDATVSPLTFNKAQENKWDVYDDHIAKVDGKTDYELALQSSTDAMIVENGVLKVDYEGCENVASIVSNDNYDGSYTMWGFGGMGDAGTVTFNIKATDKDVAKYMTVRFYQSADVALEKKFDEWLVENNYNAEIPVDDEFHEYVLAATGKKQGLQIQGMKISFERSEKAGTVYFGPILYDGNAIENFSNKPEDRKNYVVDIMDGTSLPYIRSIEYSEGVTDDAISGCNIYKDRMWTMSTADANIVNNLLSGNTNALQIKYQKTKEHNTYARLKATEMVSDEPLMAITLKGADASEAELAYENAATDAKIDEILNVVLYNGKTKVETIPFNEFFESDEIEKENPTHTAVSADTYKTYYTSKTAGKVFDTIAFEIAGDEDTAYSGRIFVQDIYFPRYTYEVKHFYDSKEDTDLRKTKVGAKWHEAIPAQQQPKTNYYYKETKATGAIKQKDRYLVGSTADVNEVNLYYTSDIPYSVVYYTVDGNTVTEFKTVTGEGAKGTVVKRDDNITKTGYKYSYSDPKAETITLTPGVENVLNVYYVKDSFDYTIEYYYDGKLDNTVTDKAEYGSTISDTKPGKDGYKLDKRDPESNQITITEDKDKNIIKVYYVKDSFDYTVNYYYDNQLDGTKTETGKKEFDSTLNYKDFGDKSKTGYVFEKVEPSESIKITSDISKNVIDVYYKLGEYPYTIKYYYDGVEDKNKMDEGTAEFNSTVKEGPGKDKPGFTKLDHEEFKITKEEGNVFEVYYTKNSYGYTVEYYYDGKLEKTVPGSAAFGATVTYKDENKTGYKFEKVEPSKEITITENADNNVIKVYYVKDNFGYRIEHYYDNELDGKQTDNKTAEYQSVIEYNQDMQKLKPGYKFTSALPEKITISEVAADNVLKLYYEKDSYDYTIEYYYDNVIDAGKTIKDKAVFGSTIKYPDKAKDGYVFDRTDKEDGQIVISEVAGNNIIRVYYKSGEFKYTVNYYYDGELDIKATETKSAQFEEKITTYDDKRKTGYKLDKVEPAELTISFNEQENVINVYYVTGKYPYTIKYYYDGELDASKTETGEKLYGEEVTYDKANVLDGYKLVNVTPSEKMTISENDNVMEVYLVRDTFEYRIEYYYDNVIKNEYTINESALFDETITFTDNMHKYEDGFKFASANPENKTIKITSDKEQNVLKIYYTKDNFPYTVEYYYDGELDADKNGGGTAKYGEEVTYEDKVIPGYKLDTEKTGTGKLTVTDKPEDNIIRVYYVKDNFDYTVNYYFDGELKEELTDKGTAEFGSEIGYTDKNKDGYKFVETSKPDNKLTISSVKEDNVLNVYYVKDEFEYTIKYYYDGVLDDDLTVTDKATFESQITYSSKMDKLKPGYAFVETKPASQSITISSDKDKNVLEIYYAKDTFKYTVEYYYDNKLDDSKTDTKDGVFGSEVTYTDKKIDGYKLDAEKTGTGKLTVTDKLENNVIKVYYVKDSFNYTIEYYYDGEIDNDLTDKGIAEFESEVGYTDKNKDGFKFVGTDPADKLIITSDETKNVLKVHYAKDNFPYHVEYYYDGKLDDTKTSTGTAKFGEEVTYEDKVIPGYVLDYVNPATAKITISATEANNVIKVYYKKAQISYTVRYYENGELKETVVGTGIPGENIPFLTSKDGFKFVKQEGNTVITTVSEGNVVSVYFETKSGKTKADTEKKDKKKKKTKKTADKEIAKDMPKIEQTNEERTNTVQTNTVQTNAVQTGDYTSLATMLAGFLSSMALLVVMIFKRRKLS